MLRQHGEWHNESSKITTWIVSSTQNKHWILAREESLKTRGLSHLFDNDTVVAGAVQTQMLQDGPHLQQSQSVTAEGTRTEGLSCPRRRNDCGNRAWWAVSKGQPHRRVSPWTVLNYLSICERNLVSKMPLVLSVSEIWPLNRKPLLVISIRILRTISPRYMPLHIFSYLRDTRRHHKQTTDTLNVCFWRHTSRKIKEFYSDDRICHGRDVNLCWPGLREKSSTARSYSVLMSSRHPLSPKAPHSMLMHICPSSPSIISTFLISSM